MSQSFVRQVLEESQEVLNRFLSDTEKIKAVAAAGALMVEAIQNGNKIISCGNGGELAQIFDILCPCRT